ncbi:hypothetical protein [Falsiroseomonas tokyonensis]|uniref:Uncharacterized protein n=1 Tax=Falsiroseomonas tokyonensis TaxID=430521 RepID=A0ABV7BXD4_9PROT|nr:hypothetical protein [Falsiroseomonas tokyonensis]MBU8540198.1 hypothetical protein [Falsiroseomonas tokyonensis]
MARMTPSEAREVLRHCKVNLHVDFHALDSDKVQALVAAADREGYRKPKNANGSRARSYHARLVRLAEREDI